MTIKHLFSTFIAVFLLSFIITGIDIEQVFGLGTAVPPAQDQTIPTRTPTARPATNTPTPKSNNGGNPSTAVPTSTLPPAITPTNTVVVTIAYTPVGGFVPTAEPCSSQPTILARNPTNVREGPGTDYAIVGQLVYLEVRLILGRAADSTWWLIQLDYGAMGWVADDVVTVQGYIGSVPVIAAPEINGDTPTPGTPWNPTPYPFCTVTPTFTPQPTATLPPATPEAETAVTQPTQPETTLNNTAVPPTDTATAPPEPTQTAVAPPTLPPTAVPATDQPDVNIINAQSTASPLPVNEASGSSPTDLLLP
ncbi:MAG: SH3 domain-containing protein, partial [Anaerolineae bacterium]